MTLLLTLSLSCGPTHTDVFFPAASIYTSPQQTAPAAVTFNFGPTFKWPPPRLDNFPEPQPLSTLGARAAVDDGGADAAASEEPHAQAASDVQDLAA